MSIYGINPGAQVAALNQAVQSINSANLKLLEATKQINDGDIIDAVLLIQQSKIEASAGAAVAKVSIKVSESLLDILA
ncbi:MAG TPA: hypothetical protein VGB30_05775 [bacterium]|jgi:hypothetical protein